MLTQALVLDALRKVNDPELNRDIVSLGMVKDLSIDGAKVKLTLVLTTPACPLRAEIEKEVREAVLAIPGVEGVDMATTASVVSRGQEGRKMAYGVKHVVAVASGKGGVGKSTVSANLAVALAEFGAAVGILDADIYGPSIPLMMGASGSPRGEGDRIAPLEAHGIKIMSIGFMLPEGAPVIWRGPMVAGAVTQFLRDVDWGDLDYLLVDLPPGTGDAQLSLSQAIPLTGVVIVMTPQDVARTIATKALAMFRQMKVPVLGIIENMSYFLCPYCQQATEVFYHGGARRTAERLGVPFLGEIPLDGEICQSGDAGEPMLIRSPSSPAADLIRRITANLAGRISVETLSAPAAPLGPIQLRGG